METQEHNENSFWVAIISLIALVVEVNNHSTFNLGNLLYLASHNNHQSLHYHHHKRTILLMLSNNHDPLILWSLYFVMTNHNFINVKLQTLVNRTTVWSLSVLIMSGLKKARPRAKSRDLQQEYFRDFSWIYTFN